MPRSVHLVEVTFDPSRDTPGVIARYGRRFGADPERWTIATDSDITAVTAFAGYFGAGEAPTGTGRAGRLEHVEHIALIGPDGRVATTLDDGGVRNPDDLLDEARAVAGLPVHPGLRLELALRRFDAIPERERRALGLLFFAFPTALLLIGLMLHSLQMSRRPVADAVARPATHSFERVRCSGSDLGERGERLPIAE